MAWGRLYISVRAFGDASVKIFRSRPTLLAFFRGFRASPTGDTAMPIHLGQLIRQKLIEDGHSVTWFASQICCTRSNVYKIFANDNIDVRLLERICRVLRYNFFQDLAQDNAG